MPFRTILARLIILAFGFLYSLAYASESPVTGQEYILLKKEFNALGFRLSEFGTPNLTIWDHSEIPWGMVTSSEFPPAEYIEELTKQVGEVLFSKQEDAYQISCFENYKGKEKSHLCICFLKNRGFNFFMSFTPEQEALFMELVESINHALEGK